MDDRGQILGSLTQGEMTIVKQADWFTRYSQRQLHRELAKRKPDNDPLR